MNTLFLVVIAALAVWATWAMRRRKKSVDCVISACDNEGELEYTKSIVRRHYGKDVRFFVYEKCRSTAGNHKRLLPNRGREQHTYCHHVATNYNDLADTVIFTPANIRGKRPAREETIIDGSRSTNAGFRCTESQTFGSMERWHHNPWYEGRPLDTAKPQGICAWAHAHLGRYPRPNRTACKWGTFVSTRVLIHRTPVETFMKVRDELDVPEPEAGHYMERLVPVLYGHD